MEELHDYASSKLSNGEKVRLSEFLNSVDFASIGGYDYGDTWDDGKVKNTWRSLFTSEQTRSQPADKVAFSLDSYRVDWHELETRIKKYKNDISIEIATTNVHCEASKRITNAIESANIFQQSPDTLSLDFLSLRKNITEWQKNASSTQKQDLLYYGILDLTATNECGTKKVLGNTYDLFKKHVESQLLSSSSLPREIHRYARQVLKNLDLDKCLKKAKKQIKDDDLVWKKSVLKIMKVYHKCISDPNGQFLNHQTETHYLCTFVQPVLDLAFGDLSGQYSRLWGEARLKAAKEQRNDALEDGNRRVNGPGIDGIYTHVDSDFETMIVELSGANTSPVYGHFLGDRAKIAQNLKRMMKTICKATTHPQMATLGQLKLIGLQFYDNALYVYYLKMVSWHMYVFGCEQVVDLPTKKSHCARKMAKMMNWLWEIKMALLENDKVLNDLFVIEETDSDSFSTHSLNTPDGSPRGKKRKTQAS